MRKILSTLICAMFVLGSGASAKPRMQHHASTKIIQLCAPTVQTWVSAHNAPARAVVQAAVYVNGRPALELPEDDLNYSFTRDGTYVRISGQRQTAPLVFHAVATQGCSRVRVWVSW